MLTLNGKSTFKKKCLNVTHLMPGWTRRKGQRWAVGRASHGRTSWWRRWARGFGSHWSWHSLVLEDTHVYLPMDVDDFTTSFC